MPDKAMLLVDDDFIILVSMAQELKGHFGDQFEYRTATSADEAFSTISDLANSGITLILVISDWMMPGMKGDEFLMEVKRKYPHIKTIMISGYSTEESCKKIKNSNITDFFIPKPWNHEMLISSVEKCVECGE